MTLSPMYRPDSVKARGADIAWLALLCLLAFFLRVYALDSPSGLVFDERHYYPSAQCYLEGRQDCNAGHPAWAKLQIAAGMVWGHRICQWSGGAFLSGFESQARFNSACCGTVVVALTFLLARQLLKRREWAVLAAFLVASDFMSVSISRLIMLDGTQVMWSTLGACGAWWAACAWVNKGRAGEVSFERRMADCALAFGLATACKWNGLFGASGALAFLMLVCLPLSDRGAVKRFWRAVLLFGTTLCAAYGLIELVKIALYPSWKLGWYQEVSYHLGLLGLHQQAWGMDHIASSYWWQWPWAIRPVWTALDFFPGGRVQGHVLFGSLVFWLPAFLAAARCAWAGWSHWRECFSQQGPGKQERQEGARLLSPCLFTACLFFPQWLLWALGSTGGFLYYISPLVPWLALALVLWLTELPRAWTLLLIPLVTLAFVAYAPFLMGLLTSREVYLLLFPTWLPWR